MADKLDPENIPEHIAIIMDGNGRWAQQRGLPRSMGHKAGLDSLRITVKTLNTLGVKHLTVYAFSTENWKRPKEEVGILMSLVREYIYKEILSLHHQKVRLSFIGDLSGLPTDIQHRLSEAMEKTRLNPGMHFSIALNYGGREEILYAARCLAKQVQSGIIDPQDIDAQAWQKHLYTAGTPDPELIIRTSGEMRLSNFLLWQGAYSELVLTDRLWPDFREDDLFEAIREFQRRQRRFGGLT